MIGSLPRPLPFDAPAPPQALALGVAMPDAEAPHRRPTPVEPVEAVAQARREQPQAISRRAEPDREATPPRDRTGAPASDTSAVAREPAGRLGMSSAPFIAQLLGQNDMPRDAVSAARSQTSFRTSHVEKYEQVLRWTRQVELLFSFDCFATPCPA